MVPNLFVNTYRTEGNIQTIPHIQECATSDFALGGIFHFEERVLKLIEDTLLSGA